MTRLFRKRYIPDETVLLKDDEVVLIDGEVVITRWKPLKPRRDFAAGASCVFLGRGFKVSALYDEGGGLIKYYCDIVRAEARGEDYIFRDLLVDVTVSVSGEARVLDLDELAEAARGGVLPADDVAYALSALDDLLKTIYGGGFGELAARLP